MPGINLQLADEFASEYDINILNNDWNGPDLIFRLSNSLLKEKSKILDIGIGTGESSRRFQKAGHIITGIDGSEKMLKQCKNKKIGKELLQHDIETHPIPFEKNCFDAVISNGVFHLIYPLEKVFTEVNRILKSQGFFVFTYENLWDTKESTRISKGTYSRHTNSGVSTYKYSNKIIKNYLSNNRFRFLTQKRFVAFTNKDENKQVFFTAVVAQRL